MKNKNMPKQYHTPLLHGAELLDGVRDEVITKKTPVLLPHPQQLEGGWTQAVVLFQIKGKLLYRVYGGTQIEHASAHVSATTSLNEHRENVHSCHTNNYPASRSRWALQNIEQSDSICSPACRPCTL